MIRQPLILSVLLVATALSTATCNTDDGNDVLNQFEAGACKTVPETSGSLLPTGHQTSDLNGLMCVAWSLEGDGHLHVNLVNHSAMCLFSGQPGWEGDAVFRDGDLELLVFNEIEGANLCGNCLYNWMFDLDALDLEGDLDLVVSVKNYQGADTQEIERAMIPLSESTEGIRCRYVAPFPLGWDPSHDGGLHLPCRVDGTGTPCDDGLACEDVPSSYGAEERCLQPCSADDDCPLDGLLSCQAGICLLAGEL
jgi:hypothetical protein